MARRWCVTGCATPGEGLDSACPLLISARKGGFQEELDFVAITARQLELLSAFEREEILAVHMCAQRFHPLQVHNGGAVYTLEESGVEQAFQLLHRAAQDMRLTAGVDAHVIPRGVDPVDRGDRHSHDVAPL